MMSMEIYDFSFTTLEYLFEFSLQKLNFDNFYCSRIFNLLQQFIRDNEVIFDT